MHHLFFPQVGQNDVYCQYFYYKNVFLILSQCLVFVCGSSLLAHNWDPNRPKYLLTGQSWEQQQLCGVSKLLKTSNLARISARYPYIREGGEKRKEREREILMEYTFLILANATVQIYLSFNISQLALPPRRYFVFSAVIKFTVVLLLGWLLLKSQLVERSY